MRYLFGFIFVLALSVMGCGETAGDPGGSGGDGGMGGDAGSGGTDPCDVECQVYERFVDAFVAERRIAGGPGIALSIMGPDKVVFEKGYGMANIADSIEIGLDTPFELASVSKQFTAMAALLLYEDGKVALDDRISTVFPEAPPAWAEITVHHLLTHQSGIPTPAIADRVGWTNEDVLEWAVQQPLLFTPGEEYKYSNVGYILLASLVERLAGQSFESFMADRIFAPLGMQDSGVGPFPPNIPNRAISYSILAPMEQSLPQMGAGNVHSTINDLQLWEAELRNVTLVSPATLDLMFTPHVEVPDYLAGTGSFYGYGWHMLQLGDWPPSQEHTGRRWGFRNAVIRFPETGLAIHMVSNGSFAWAMGLVFDNLVDLYLTGELPAETKSLERAHGVGAVETEGTR